LASGLRPLIVSEIIISETAILVNPPFTETEKKFAPLTYFAVSDMIRK
jgi:hypothetical protein